MAQSVVGVWPLLVVAILLGFIGWAVDQRPVRARFRLLHTPAPRIMIWEASLQKLIEDLYPARVASISVSEPKFAVYTANDWNDERRTREIILFLLRRRELLDKLSTDVRS